MVTRPTGKGGIFGDFARLLEQLPHYAEREELIILKGHLLVEELLRAYVDTRLPNASAFHHRQFSFCRCVMIAKALTVPSNASWVFEGATKLNSLRNDIAHNLDPNEYSTHMADFLSWIEGHEADPTVRVSERGEARLYLAVTHLFHSLSDMANRAANAR